MFAHDSQTIQSLLDRIAKSSAAFAERATLLSQTIEQIEISLCSMPGKLPCEIEGDSIKVEFDRKLERWGLWLTDSESWDEQGRHCSPDDLTRVSVARKARAFPLLLELLPKIEATQKEQVELIDTAVAELGLLPRSSADAPAKKPGPGKTISVLPPRQQTVVRKGANDDLPF